MAPLTVWSQPCGVYTYSTLQLQYTMATAPTEYVHKIRDENLDSATNMHGAQED